ncbi:hypothetical protein BCD72_004288 [Clostridium butyricum]|nr:hypothetical protein [Clostridium butyricum]MBA8973426.1 hypothetical protein [Clostridium butyricum]NOW39629.1 hypothetical protein [Clostridium butyricum]
MTKKLILTLTTMKKLKNVKPSMMLWVRMG